MGFALGACGKREGRERRGVLTLPHGRVETPAFIFCATRGAIKGVGVKDLRSLGVEIILGNTYHLMVRPGEEVVEQSGGLQKFTGWGGPMLTDSGGFQIFSLGFGSVTGEIKGQRHNKNSLIVKKDEEGVVFRSHLDGKRLGLTPERSIEIQRSLGSDIILVLDECTPYHVDKRYTELSMELSHRWALRSYEEFCRGESARESRGLCRQGLYGIVQGGVYEDLRLRSVDFVNGLPFFGYAVGGCLGGSREEMREVVDFSCEGLQEEKPRHLLGIGDIESIFHGVRCGIDTFDCVSPTRIGRHGWALVKGGERRLNMSNARFRDDQEAMSPWCDGECCRGGYSRAYIHHLLRVGESLGGILLTYHNIRFMTGLMEAIRKGIESGRLRDVEREWLEG